MADAVDVRFRGATQPFLRLSPAGKPPYVRMMSRGVNYTCVGNCYSEMACARPWMANSNARLVHTGDAAQL